ncbi:HalOD1 output domain-containing protein [Halosimplex halophilum]|uniref:HalOD1 output domain-containing protein n=1 Tax=Halosimplex halophilum TaxID=2559572 RepID=UPI00107FBEA3|nr:HalOD1 output domain-containing protein [Halosimplex halophilum]
MAREPFDDADETGGDQPGIVRARIEPRSETAEHEFLELIAGLEGVDATELPSLYREVDHAVENLFKRPPSSGAQMEIAFSYAGYRVTIDQRGHVRLIRVGDTVQ